MGALDGLDAIARELMLFAAVGLLVGGLDDLLVDGCYAALRFGRPHRRLTLATLPPAPTTRFAVFVLAWDEATVISAMLDTLLTRFGETSYQVWVGCYPNDPATIGAVRAVADPRVRLVIADKPGPTTKADNLNALWRAFEADGGSADAVVIHDAEDVVHPAELRVFAALLAAHDAVQLPVLPIVGRSVPMIASVYGDEFAEMHGRGLTVRSGVGASLPLAGTGCAIRVERLRLIAGTRAGLPFNAASLVEDYEMGLHLAATGARGCFARVREEKGGPLVAVRAIFPGTFDAAVRQKARWIAGIALIGWDRTGWARPSALADHWMRLRDRRAPLATAVLLAAYLAMLSWIVSAVAHWTVRDPRPALDRLLAWLLVVNTGLLAWRLLMRMVFTGRAYGPREAWLSLPRFLIGNAVALAATPRALRLYWRLLRGGAPVWDKTAHSFPDLAVIGMR